MIYSIQFLRFIAAALVVVFHVQAGLAFRLDEEMPHIIQYVFGFGAVGVHIFFVISGFIIVYTQRHNFGAARPVDFVWRRALRIYPLYWLCAAATVAVALLFGVFDMPDTPHEWIASLLLVPGHASGIIFIGWTLAYEMTFYIAFAVILSFNLRLLQSVRALTLLFCSLVLIGKFTHASEIQGLDVLTGILLLEFVMGAWVAYFTLKTPKDRFALGMMCAIFGLAAFAIGLAVAYYKLPRIVAWGIPSAFLIYGVAVMERARPDAFRSRFVGVLGGASYALYLIHPAIIAILLVTLDRTICTDATQLYPLVFASLLLSSIAAIVTYLYVEPNLRPRQRKKPHTTASPPVNSHTTGA